jgi:hypothetical protein
VKLSYEGSVNRPTAASISFGYSPSSVKKKPGPAIFEKTPGERERLAAEAKINEGMRYKPGSRQDIEQSSRRRRCRTSTCAGWAAFPVLPDAPSPL